MYEYVEVSVIYIFGAELSGAASAQFFSHFLGCSDFHHSGIVCGQNFVGVVFSVRNFDVLSDDGVFEGDLLADDGVVAEKRSGDVGETPDVNVVHDDAVGQPQLGIDDAAAADHAVLDGRSLGNHRSLAHKTLLSQGCIGIDFAVWMNVGDILRRGFDLLCFTVQIDKVVEGVDPHAVVAGRSGPVQNVGETPQNPVLVARLQVAGTRVPARQTLRPQMNVLQPLQVVVNAFHTFFLGAVWCFILDNSGCVVEGTCGKVIRTNNGFPTELLLHQIWKNLSAD